MPIIYAKSLQVAFFVLGKARQTQPALYGAYSRTIIWSRYCICTHSDWRVSVKFSRLASSWRLGEVDAQTGTLGTDWSDELLSLFCFGCCLTYFEADKKTTSLQLIIHGSQLAQVDSRMNIVKVGAFGLVVHVDSHVL